MALKVDIEQAKKVKESSFEFEDESHVLDERQSNIQNKLLKCYATEIGFKIYKLVAKTVTVVALITPHKDDTIA